MSTTAIFAEILIVGLLTVLAVMVAVAASFGLQAGAVSLLKDWAIPGTLGVVAVAYPVGIAVDRIADSLAKAIETKFFPAPLALSEQEMRFRVWEVAPARITDFLDYARSRRRVCRSTALIALPLALFLSVAAVWRGWFLAAIAVGVFALFIGCSYAWWRIGRMYDSRLELSYRINVLKQEPGAGKGLGW